MNKLTTFIKKTFVKPTNLRWVLFISILAGEGALVYFVNVILHKDIAEILILIALSIPFLILLLFIKNVESFLIVATLVLLPFNRFLILKYDHAYLLGRISDYLLLTVHLFEIPIFTLLYYKIIEFIFSKKRVNLSLIFSRKTLIVVSVIGFYVLINTIQVFKGVVDFWYVIPRFQNIFLIIFISIIVRRISVTKLFSILFLGGILQSVLAIIQVAINHAIGLTFLGESQFNQMLFYIAKSELFGMLRVRGYGTFPHPNVLAAFLLFSIVAGIYLFLKRYTKEDVEKNWDIKKLAHVFGLMIVIIGLLLTQSRTVIIALLSGTVISVIYIVFKYFRKTLTAYYLILGVIASSLTLGYFFRDRILSLWSYDNSSITHRLMLQGFASEFYKNNPMFGIGAGNFLKSIAEKSGIVTNHSFIVEPVHNIWLLILSESGIFIFLSIIALLIWRIVNSFRNEKNIGNLILKFYMLSVLLFTSNLDHYLLTLKQGSVILGILLSLLL